MNKTIKHVFTSKSRLARQAKIICTVIILGINFNLLAFSADTESVLWNALTSGEHYVTDRRLP